MSQRVTRVSIVVDEATRVSGLFQEPSQAKCCVVLAPGAGAGMEHPFAAALAYELENLGVATLRYQFPYRERERNRPDPPALCHATVRAAVLLARSLAPKVPLFAGGKSFGGRMTSQAQAIKPLAGVQGLVFLGFPLHPPQEPSVARATHLFHIQIPMLFLQGSRDTFASRECLVATIEKLQGLATLRLLEGADHSFHVLKKSGLTEADVRAEMLAALMKWLADHRSA